ncbi:methylenetetrahydrofolate reductase [Helicobacter sp.]|uniref:methylenetetrahydrofolate reductase n=1 Tax=Helicobacter sp. TaxID=218 RepID=UPI0025BAFF9F|nr:methylenetetrahydrofolate reductase [Helicobacter sp.]MCI5968652.1 methylenetetrahydrofolate reductase [Helicobacter sp.]MDY2584474.1 methylenetetrahydrofolate reductase [Helicobacter sp.]
MQSFDGQKIESFINNLQSADKCYTYEFSAPASFLLEDLFDALKSHSFLNALDAFVCTDSPLGKLRHSPILASLKLQNAFGIPSIATISMRDKNTLALQSELIGMNSLDLRLILALTGDPLRLGNQPQAKGVFEGNSRLLLKIIAALNANKDINGKSLGGNAKRIYPFCVLNSYTKSKEGLYRKMREKIQNGALMIFTQPIYDIGVAEELLEWCAKINLEQGAQCVLMFGFFPILSYKTALFLHNKLPGVFVPKTWLDALEVAQRQGDEKEVGLQKSKELFQGLSVLQKRFHFMSANKPEIIASILEA